MAAGFQVFNDQGFIQIDGEYQNMYLVVKGQVTTPATGNQMHVIPRPAGYPNPVMAVKCSSAWALVLGDADNFRLLVAPDGAGVAGVVEYFIFAVRPAGYGGGSSGLQVFDATGKIVFDSGDRMMKVVGRFTTPMAKHDEASGTIAGSKVAVICNIRPTHIESNFVVIQQVTFSIIATFCGSVKSAPINGWHIAHTEAGSSQGPPTQNYSYSSNTTDYLFVDVNGY